MQTHDSNLRPSVRKFETGDIPGTAAADTTVSTPNTPTLGSGETFAAKLLRVAGRLTPSLPPSPDTRNRGDVHQENLPRWPAPNVRGVSPAPSRPNVRGVYAPIAGELMQEALAGVRRHVPAVLSPHFETLYSAWLAELLAGVPVLAARPAQRFLHLRIRTGLRVAILPGGLHALAGLFRAKAFAQGILRANPRYTGRPPYPRFILADGGKHEPREP